MIPLKAAVASVIVLEDRASVTRRGALSVAAGQHRVVVEGVSPVIADKTLAVVATGARVLDVRCERTLAPWRDPDASSSEPILALRAERIRLSDAIDAAAARAQIARAEVDAIGGLVAAALHELAVHAARGVAVAEVAQELALLDGLDAAARVRRVDAELEVRDADAARTRLDQRIVRAETAAGEETARLVIELIADQPADVGLTIGYVVPGAAWRPYHRAILVRGATDARIDWQTTACVWQATGEDWVDAQLTFSLDRPSLGVEPPELGDDVVQARRRPDTVVVETREQEHQTTGLGGGPAQVPGIDDGGLGLRLVAAATTIRCDGMPHRVAVGGFTAAARLELVAIPLRSPWVHLRAELTNAGTTPLLAGPVDLIAASGYVGRGEVGFVAAGEKLALGFGPEADVRVHRTETRDHDEAGLLGGWNVQTTKVCVRVSNLAAAPRSLVVTERVPISEIEQVEVQVAAADAYRLESEQQITARTLGERGQVSWTVELPALGRRAVTLEYRVRSQRNIAGV